MCYNMNNHNIIAIADENGENQLTNFLSNLTELAKDSDSARMHLSFLLAAMELLSTSPLTYLIGSNSELTIYINGEKRTKSYQLVKPLRLRPIYELRYAMNANEHVRFLFFPILYKEQSTYVIVKVFIKTRIPDNDPTNVMRDLAFRIYKQVVRNPKKFLEGNE